MLRNSNPPHTHGAVKVTGWDTHAVVAQSHLTKAGRAWNMGTFYDDEDAVAIVELFMGKVDGYNRNHHQPKYVLNGRYPKLQERLSKNMHESLKALDAPVKIS